MHGSNAFDARNAFHAVDALDAFHAIDAMDAMDAFTAVNLMDAAAAEPHVHDVPVPGYAHDNDMRLPPPMDPYDFDPGDASVEEAFL